MSDDYEFQERCAIKEYLGNLPRAEAERQAKEELRKARMKEKAEAQLKNSEVKG